MNDYDRSQISGLSSGVSPGPKPGSHRRVKVPAASAGIFKSVKQSGVHPKRPVKGRPSSTADLVKEVNSSAEEFIKAIETDANSVESVEVRLRGRPEQFTSVTSSLNNFLKTAPFGDRVSVKIIRDTPDFRVILSLKQSRSGDIIVMPELTATTGKVEIETTAGPIEYTPPIDLFEDAYTSVEVGKILSARGTPNRMVATRRRNSSELIGLPVGNQFFFPHFQIDEWRKEIIPLVGQVNKQLEAVVDPWGALSWWFTASTLLGGASPHDLLKEGRLDEETVRVLIESERIGMG